MLDTIDHGEIRELRLARPPANALNPALIRGLADAVEAAPAAGVRALVISGRPGMFSGGLDVPEFLTLDRDGMLGALRDFFRLMRTLAASEVPIVAAITGHAPAGGAVISIFCDRRVMADGDFRIGLNEVQVGGRYTAKVSGKIQVVRIVEIREVPATNWSRAKTQIEAVNEATGRRVTIRSPQRLRRAAGGCEFCSAAHNRPAGGFTCPYCNKVWPPAAG